MIAKNYHDERFKVRIVNVLVKRQPVYGLCMIPLGSVKKRRNFSLNACVCVSKHESERTSRHFKLSNASIPHTRIPAPATLVFIVVIVNASWIRIAFELIHNLDMYVLHMFRW